MKARKNIKGFVHWVVLIILLVVAAVVGTVYFLRPIQKSETSTVPSSATNSPMLGVPINNDISNWKTYKNDKYGFELKYPDLVSLYENKDKDKAALLAYIPVCNITDQMAACFSYPGKEYSKTNFEAAGLSINVIANSNTAEECLNFVNPGHVIIKNKQINGIDFTYISNGGAAGGHGQEGFTYRTFYNGTCFETTTAVSFDSTNTPPRNAQTLTEIDKAKIFGILDQILSTFKFIQKSG